MVLTDRNKELLKESIKHWKEDIIPLLKKGNKFRRPCVLIDGKEVNLPCYREECPLCREYLGYFRWDNTCSECPISMAGFGCDDGYSPWKNFINSSTIREARVRAKIMIQMMESILDKTKEKKYIVSVAKEQWGFVEIEAKNIGEARHMAREAVIEGQAVWEDNKISVDTIREERE